MKRYAELFIGKRLRSREEASERLSNPTALAVLSSDALSSVAYATEEILLVLAAGALFSVWALPISAAIIFLLFILTISYRQTIHAYPQGAGAYIVAGENLGIFPGLIAGAALLLDYILTVAVSISAGTAALTSAASFLHPYRVPVALALCLLLTVGNLRGVKESGKLFRLPTFLFIGGMAMLIGAGFFQLRSGIFPGVASASAPFSLGEMIWYIAIFRLMHAFASGSTALTGVEAISNGTKIFHEPASRNARKTLVWMACILGVMFLGITYLAVQFGVRPHENETVLSQLARAIFTGSWHWVYYVFQIATVGILALAANTAFAGFPRLAQFIARDKFLPRYLTTRGGRLVFSNGILLLASVAGVLLLVFRADTHAIIPLYMVGVFVSFTLSQAGMARKYFRSNNKGDHFRALINTVGAVVTSAVLLIVFSTKFLDGAWITFLAIPSLVFCFLVVRRHYVHRARNLRAFLGGDKVRAWKQAIEKASVTHAYIKHAIQAIRKKNENDSALVERSYIVPISAINEAVVMTLYDIVTEFSRHHIEVLHVAIDDDEAERVRAEWEKIMIEDLGFPPEIELRVVIDEYRDVLGALEREVWERRKHWAHDKIFVKIPHLDYPSFFDYLLTANYPVRIAFTLRRLIERKVGEKTFGTDASGGDIFMRDIAVDLVAYPVPASSSLLPIFLEEVRVTGKKIKDFIMRRELPEAKTEKKGPKINDII